MAILTVVLLGGIEEVFSWRTLCALVIIERKVEASGLEDVSK